VSAESDALRWATVRTRGAPASTKVGRSELIAVAIRPDVRVVRGNLSAHDLALLRQWIDLNRAVIIRLGMATFIAEATGGEELQPAEVRPSVFQIIASA
jgi:hypothetical protein